MEADELAKKSKTPKKAKKKEKERRSASARIGLHDPSADADESAAVNPLL